VIKTTLKSFAIAFINASHFFPSVTVSLRLERER